MHRPQSGIHQQMAPPERARGELLHPDGAVAWASSRVHALINENTAAKEEKV